MINETLRKWGPILDKNDKNSILTLDDKINISALFEDYSFQIQPHIQTNLNPLPIFLKNITKIKEKLNINFKYNNIPSINNVSINLGIIDDIIIDDNIYNELLNLYTNNDVIVHVISNINNSVILKCTLIKKEVVKIEKNFQECAHLEIEDVFSTSKNTLGDLYNLQKDIQENVYGYDFTAMQEGPLPQLRSFFDWNYHSIQDELRETFNALGGMSDGIGNGVWKPWKKAYHEQAPNMTYVDMSERDKKELKMELIDIQHFLFNMMLAVGMTEQELMNFYFAKNKENRRRNRDGY